MKFTMFLFATAVSACSGLANASSGSLNEFPPKVLPVLVQVDSHGRVTSASPSTELTPKLTRLLRSNLDEMINEPAFDDRGRPKSSQFILNLAVQTSLRADGKYDANFAYVSTAPVPAGSWYWVHVDGHRLALANQNSANRPSLYYDRQNFQGYQRQGPVSMPAGNMGPRAPTAQRGNPAPSK